MGRRRDLQIELVELMLEYGESRVALAEAILERLEEAWDNGRSTGRYDGLYQDPTYWDDEGNPYREDEDGDST